MDKQCLTTVPRSEQLITKKQKISRQITVSPSPRFEREKKVTIEKQLGKHQIVTSCTTLRHKVDTSTMKILKNLTRSYGIRQHAKEATMRNSSEE